MHDHTVKSVSAMLKLVGEWLIEGAGTCCISPPSVGSLAGNW